MNKRYVIFLYEIVAVARIQRFTNDKEITFTSIGSAVDRLEKPGTLGMYDALYSDWGIPS